MYTTATKIKYSRYIDRRFKIGITFLVYISGGVHHDYIQFRHYYHGHFCTVTFIFTRVKIIARAYARITAASLGRPHFSMDTEFISAETALLPLITHAITDMNSYFTLLMICWCHWYILFEPPATAKIHAGFPSLLVALTSFIYIWMSLAHQPGQLMPASAPAPLGPEKADIWWGEY